MENMHVESSSSSSSGHAEISDDHVEMKDRINFGMLAKCVSTDDLLEEEEGEEEINNSNNDDHYYQTTEKSPENMEEGGISSATSAVSSDEDPWRQDVGELSLPEVHGSIKIFDEDNASWFRKLLAFVGPGALVAVGYMDVRSRIL